jgi:hypothetical protein
MASLTEISIISRKGIRYGIYLLIFALIARFSFNLIRTIYLRIFPPPPPEVTVPFGILPKIPFPQKEFPEGLNFTLETADGQFPKLASQLPVYEMPPIPQNINALNDAKAVVRSLNFDPNGKPILESTPNVWIFNKPGAPATLTMNIITGGFSINYDYVQNPSALLGVPSEQERAKSQIKTLLQNGGLLTPDLIDGNYTHQFIRAQGNTLSPVDSLSEANLIKINIFRRNRGTNNDIPSVTPEMPEANVWFIFGSNTNQIIRGEYYHFPISDDKTGTYPLKTSETAWEDLKSKNAFIVSLGDNVDNNITVRRIYHAYFDWGQYQAFYQPVVVFEGDDGFLAYVPAVESEFYGADAVVQNN